MSAFTLFHVALSLVGIAAGFVVLFGMFSSRRLDGWTAAFLATSLATNATGFLLPAHMLMPSHIVGIVSSIALLVALVARYGRHLAGAWRWIYAVTAIVGLYLNVFVLIAQLFQKVPALTALAPTGSEPPFLVAQVAVMAAFIVLGILAVRRFHVSPPAVAAVAG